MSVATKGEVQSPPSYIPPNPGYELASFRRSDKCRLILLRVQEPRKTRAGGRTPVMDDLKIRKAAILHKTIHGRARRNYRGHKTSGNPGRQLRKIKFIFEVE